MGELEAAGACSVLEAGKLCKGLNQTAGPDSGTPGDLCCDFQNAQEAGQNTGEERRQWVGLVQTRAQSRGLPVKGNDCYALLGLWEQGCSLKQPELPGAIATAEAGTERQPGCQERRLPVRLGMVPLVWRRL